MIRSVSTTSPSVATILLFALGAACGGSSGAAVSADATSGPPQPQPSAGTSVAQDRSDAFTMDSSTEDVTLTADTADGANGTVATDGCSGAGCDAGVAPASDSSTGCAATCRSLTLASGQQRPSGIAVDATRVYWTNVDGGTIVAVPLDGGTPIVLAAGQDSPTYVAVDTANVYWATSSTVMKAPLDGGAPVAIATGQYLLTGIAVDTTGIYWTGGNGVTKAPLDGGAPFALTSSGFATSLVIDSTTAYWVEDFSGTVVKAPLDGGAPLTLATGYPADGIVVDSANVYWMNLEVGVSNGTLIKVPLDGGSPARLASVASGGPLVGIDATDIYWTRGRNVMRMPLDGGLPVTIVTAEDQGPIGAVTNEVVVHPTGVYWTDIGRGGVFRFDHHACECACTPAMAGPCSGLQVTTCSPARRYESVGCSAACLDSVGCIACVPGAMDCNGNTPQTCDTTGHWNLLAPCVNQSCVNGQCIGVCDAHSAGRCQCGSAVVCNTSGQWNSVSCGSSACIDYFGCGQFGCGIRDYLCCSGPGPGCHAGLRCALSCNQTTCDITGSCTCTGGSSPRCVDYPSDPRLLLADAGAGGGADCGTMDGGVLGD